MENFNVFSFPVVKNISTRTIGDSIKGASSMSVEEAAAGREVRESPKKYDTFKSLAHMKNYIEDVFLEDKFLQPGWLKVDKVHTLPLNILRNDVYYTGADILQVTCYEPPTSLLQDIINGNCLLELNPEDWKKEEIEQMIIEIKQAHSK